tara:strand:+ start:4486 stop:4713 length:228 start_codon:yes stop_codon:yes gene_type:complete
MTEQPPPPKTFVDVGLTRAFISNTILIIELAEKSVLNGMKESGSSSIQEQSLAEIQKVLENWREIRADFDIDPRR